MATTTFSNYEVDPMTLLAKQKQTQLPYLDDTGKNYLPFVPQAQGAAAPQSQVAQPQTANQTQQANQTYQPGMFTNEQLAAGNQAVMGGAQNAALNQGQGNQYLQQAGTMTGQQMANPDFGYNPVQYKGNALSNFDFNRAGAVKAYKEENAPLGGSGAVQENLLETVLQGNVDRANLENQYDMAAVDRQKQDWIDAISQGRTQAESEQKYGTNAINNLLGVRGAYEGERAQTTGNEQQMEVLDKTFGQDMAKQINAQDWNGAQAALDREAAVVAQSTDINAKQAFQDKQNQFDLLRIQTTNDFTALQADLDRRQQTALQSNDINAQQSLAQLQIQADNARLAKTQDFTAMQADIDRRQQLAVQNNDIESRKYLADLQIKADAAQLQKTQDFTSVQNDIANKWKSTENSLDRTAQSDIINRQIELDKWKQTTGQEFTATQNALSRSLETSLKTMDIDGQKVLMNLKADIDSGMLKKTQDFTSAQNEADRALQTAMQNNDIQAQQAAVVLKGQIDSAAQAAQNEWNNSQRVATQGWQTSERIDQNGFDKAMQYIKQETETALQNNDFLHQQSLNNDKAALELKMQTQSMTHDESMATLNAQLQEAKANNDVERQAQIINFQTASDLETMTAKYGFDAALQNSEQGFQAKMQAGEFEQAKQMLLTQQTFQAQENIKDRALEQARIELQDKGINLQAMQAEFEAASKVGDDQGAAAILNKYLVNAGLGEQQIHVPDASQAIAADFQAQQYQFLQTHPEYGNVVNGSASLSPDGVKAFNAWFNSTTYGNAKTITDIVADTGNTIGGADNPQTPQGEAYAKLVAVAKPWTMKSSLKESGFLHYGTYRFASTPATGTPFSWKGTVYVATSGKAEMKIAGDNYEYFTAIDPNTGNTITITSK